MLNLGDRFLMERSTGLWKQLSVLRITLFVVLLFALTGCSVASAAVDLTPEPTRIVPHGVLSLPPVWTPIPKSDSSGINPDSNQHLQIGSTPESSAPFNTFQEYLVIGYSVEGQPLEIYRFGSGPRNVMIVAGIHGGYEWNTIILADEIIDYLYHHPETISSRLSIHILRSMNPDGAVLKSNPWGRGNANHVDLNRNWESTWSIDVPKPNCWDLVPLSAGPYPGSEPETQALMQYILNANIEALISYHSAGLGIFAGGKPSTPDSLSLAEAIAAVSDYPYPPIDIGCEYTGTMTDWAADHGVAAVDIELSTHWDTDLEQNLIILDTFLNWRP
jgi:predicted deacylase